MVTSNKQPDKKIVKMAEQNGAVVPQRTLLGEVNEHITCPLCRGYYIDATTIVECLHSFCRSCIIKHLQVKSYCPVCEMMINSAKPNIKLDKALQDIVYKLVPGLFQREMERRQQFYASRPGPAASATPEQRGEDTERIIFSPEDVISFSLEYADVTDGDSISSKSSDSNESQAQPAGSRRYLQCPAVVNISHLKKFLSMKFDIDSTQFAIDILYKKVPLPDYYTLMDIAYIYNWKRNEPMRFFYQIIDYVAIRNRIFDRKSSHFPDRKSSPASIEDTNVSSPTPNLNDHGSEASSGTDSPMPEESAVSKSSDSVKKPDVLKPNEHAVTSESSNATKNVNSSSQLKKCDDEVEKSQFLISFELTAKNNSTKSSPSKPSLDDTTTSIGVSSLKNQNNLSKSDENLKRKQQTPTTMPEMKKLKVDSGKIKLTNVSNTETGNNVDKPIEKVDEIPKITKQIDNSNSNANSKSSSVNAASTSMPPPPAKEPKLVQSVKPQIAESAVSKGNTPGTSNVVTPKQKPVEPAAQSSSTAQKTVSPLKLQIPKQDIPVSHPKSAEIIKPAVKKMPDLRPSGPIPLTSKAQTLGKLRLELLANNDTNIDHNKLLSQIKSSLSAPIPSGSSGDPLKSLFDSCKINIPPSLSITLTDQKSEPRSPCDLSNVDQKKMMVNKNLTSASNASAHKAPSPPVHNYIEILKLPDTDPKKSKTENDIKFNTASKLENNAGQLKPPSKPPETSTKGPVPNLKPIADTKLGKQTGTFPAPITFQQTFEQQLQSMQSDKKAKLSKNKSQVPKLVPATPKTFTAANKLNIANSKAPPMNVPLADQKLSAALDLSTPHNVQSQLGPQQTKAFETMQTIANLAKKQSIPNKLLPLALSQGNVFPNLATRPLSAGSTPPLRVPMATGMAQPKMEKTNGSQMIAIRQEVPSKVNLNIPLKIGNTNPTVPASIYSMVAQSSNSIQTSRSQTRSPSSSPKLVIAEDKQVVNVMPDHNINQSNQITSTQASIMNPPKSDSPMASPGPSKPGPKPMKPMIPVVKMPGIRQPMPPTMKPNPPMASPADYITQSQILSAQHALLRHQMDLQGMRFQNPWLKAQQQYDLLKNMSSISHQAQNDFNKDKQ